MIDHTLLGPDATRPQIEALCREAAQFKFATVCVNPAWVAACARLLAGSGVGVCSVVGFPLGATTADVKGYETRYDLRRGDRDRHGDHAGALGRASSRWLNVTSTR
jgi:deoxyribose-phosphate aldolase